MYHGSVIMNIEKMVEIGLLFEQYKELLTDKQREIVSLYYEDGRFKTSLIVGFVLKESFFSNSPST